LPKQETKKWPKSLPHSTPLPKQTKKAIFGNWSNSKLICTKKGKGTKEKKKEKKGNYKEITYYLKIITLDEN
jgi:hypothetical protein